MEKTTTFVLPDEVTTTDINKPPRDLVIVSQPKMGKSCILGDFSVKNNALVFELEKGGYEYISARKISIYPTQETSDWQAFQNYISIRNELLNKKGKYKTLIIDGLSDLDKLSEIGGTLTYMDSTIGKKFNRVGGKAGGSKYMPDDSNWKNVTTLPEGYGYQHTRKWFLKQIELFREISPYRIYAAHIVDKYIKEKGKDEVMGHEISLTGRLKLIFSSKVTSLAKLVAKNNQRYLNFEVLNDSIIAGSRAPHLNGKMLISELDVDEGIKTYWENIYGKDFNK